MSDHLTPEELVILPRMRLDADRFDAFRTDDVRLLLDIIDRLDRLLRVAHPPVRGELREALDVERDVCPTCGRIIAQDARGGPHPSPGDHDTGPHVAKAYALSTPNDPAE